MLALLCFMLNFPLALIGGGWFWLNGSLPSALIYVCLIVGGFNILARLIAWFGNGAAIHGFRLAIADFGPTVGVLRMATLEIFIWAASLVNVSLFFLERGAGG